MNIFKVKHWLSNVNKFSNKWVGNYKDCFLVCWGLVFIIKSLMDNKLHMPDPVIGLAAILALIFAVITTLYKMFATKIKPK